MTVCPLELIKLSARIRARQINLALSGAFNRRVERAMNGSVRLILQPAKGEIEILHQAGIPTSQSAGGAQSCKYLQDHRSA